MFGKRLQAQVIKKGARLIMEVEITGTPEPTVSWHKDDQPLENILKESYRTKTQGNCHTLIIDKGKYIINNCRPHILNILFYSFNDSYWKVHG